MLKLILNNHYKNGSFNFCAECPFFSKSSAFILQLRNIATATNLYKMRNLAKIAKP